MDIKVLLIDDEKDFVESLAQRLEVRDVDVKAAFSGDGALSLIQEHDFDVVILDVLMPGKDGIDTLKEIKAIKPLVQVIMLTGHATVETAIEGMKQGAFDYLIKPVEITTLLEKIIQARKLKVDHEKRIREAEMKNIFKRRGW